MQGVVQLSDCQSARSTVEAIRQRGQNGGVLLLHVSISCGAALQGRSFERLQFEGQVAQHVISLSSGSSSQLFFSIWPQVSQLAETQARPA